METGRVINRRYLLQRLIKQGQICAVYQGIDRVLQRVVAVKVVTSPYMSAYRTAIKMTAHLSHPNIIGLYDLIVEPETLYIVQEYVEGDGFAELLQKQLLLYEVANFGCQICQALMYGENALPGVCHGDLTPTAILRDSHGQVHVNNFALPSDLDYFESWSTLGGDGPAISDADLPWGTLSEERIADDSRGIGLLLYQLLTIRPMGTTSIEPPTDGRLHFPRSIPPELCETVARAVARQHPHYINSVEVLYTELKNIAGTLEQDLRVSEPTVTTFQQEEAIKPQQFSPAGAGVHGSVAATGDAENAALRLSAYPAERVQGSLLASQEVAPAAPTVADVPLPFVAPPQPQPVYIQEAPARRTSVAPLVIGLVVLGLLLFVLFFVLGYAAGYWLIPGS